MGELVKEAVNVVTTGVCRNGKIYLEGIPTIVQGEAEPYAYIDGEKYPIKRKRVIFPNGKDGEHYRVKYTQLILTRNGRPASSLRLRRLKPHQK